MTPGTKQAPAVTSPSTTAKMTTATSIATTSDSQSNADCESGTPVVDQEGNPTIVRKSATHVYNSSCDIFAGANPETFVELNYFYGKDGNSVWFDGVVGSNTALPPTKIDGADPATFTLILDSNGPGGFSSEYTKDKNHVYVYGQLIQGADPATFTIYNPPRQSPCEYDAQDDTGLYLFGGRLPAQCQP